MPQRSFEVRKLKCDIYATKLGNTLGKCLMMSRFCLGFESQREITNGSFLLGVL